jgi:predicted ATPase
MATFLRACATTAGEDGSAGALDEMRASIAERLAFGGRVSIPSHAALQAHKLLQESRLDECAAALDTGVAVSREGDQLYAMAELLRLRGELLLGQGASPAEAENAFRKALDIAHRQGARSLELRAATSLARLWAEQGRRAEARDLLAGVYGWFTEGFDTADLRAARELLAEL